MDTPKKSVPRKVVARTWRPKVPPPGAVSPPKQAPSPPRTMLGDTDPNILQMMFMQFDYDQIIGVMQDNVRAEAALDDWFWTNHMLKQIKVHPNNVNKVIRMLKLHEPQSNRQFREMRATKQLQKRGYNPTEEEVVLLANYDNFVLAHKLEELFIDSVDKCRIYYIRAIVRIYPNILQSIKIVQQLIRALVTTAFNQDCIEDVFREFAKINPEGFLTVLGYYMENVEPSEKVKLGSRVLSFLRKSVV